MDQNNIQIPTEEEKEAQKQTEHPVQNERKLKLPLVCKIIYALAALCAILYICFICFPEFSDIFNRYVSPFVRGFLATLTGWIPFSLAEFFLLMIPLIVIAIVVFGLKRYSSSWRDVLIFSLTILSVAAYVFSTFTLGFVPAYRGSRLDKKLELDKQPVSADELRDTTYAVLEELTAIESEIGFKSDGFSVMPYSYEELNDKLMDAYDVACDKYDFIPKLHSRVKRVMLSEPMTYTHISGVYTFFTGEANINTNFPDYTLPYTAAHELAHQRGIAREDEANFIAFLVCLESDDPYIRYSGLLNMYEYVASPLSAHTELYLPIAGSIDENVRREMIAYSKFFDKYRGSAAGKISEGINNSYLQSVGTAGTKSYGMVVDLAVAYLKNDFSR